MQSPSYESGLVLVILLTNTMQRIDFLGLLSPSLSLGMLVLQTQFCVVGRPRGEEPKPLAETTYRAPANSWLCRPPD